MSSAPGYGDPLTGSHHGMHRAVLNTYFPMDIRRWAANLVAPLHDGSDDQPDSTHLIRMAGRSARPGGASLLEASSALDRARMDVPNARPPWVVGRFARTAAVRSGDQIQKDSAGRSTSLPPLTMPG